MNAFVVDVVDSSNSAGSQESTVVEFVDASHVVVVMIYVAVVVVVIEAKRGIMDWEG